MGNFTDAGVASGSISPDIGKVKVIRLKVLESSPNWVILSEVGGLFGLNVFEFCSNCETRSCKLY